LRSNAFKIISYLLILGLSLAIGLAGLFGLYGWSKGYSVASAMSYLHQSDELAQSNPKTEHVSWSRVSWNGNIENNKLSESSGLASSNRYDDLLWSMNDSGNAPEIFAMTTQGKDLGSWAIFIEDPVDWEAMSSFVLDGQAYLLVADVGDNFRWRPHLTFFVVKEPDPALVADRELAVEWMVQFSYPEGVFRDCEAVAVDIRNERVLLVTKRVYPAEIYELPLTAENPVTAKKLTDLVHLPRATDVDLQEEPGIGKYRRMATGMDVKGSALALTTYQDVYLYDMRDFERAPLLVPMPLVGQRESIAFDRNTNAIAYVTRERKKRVGVADIFKIELPEFVQTPLEAEPNGQ